MIRPNYWIEKVNDNFVFRNNNYTINITIKANSLDRANHVIDKYRIRKAISDFKTGQISKIPTIAEMAQTFHRSIIDIRKGIRVKIRIVGEGRSIEYGSL